MCDVGSLSVAYKCYGSAEVAMEASKNIKSAGCTQGMTQPDLGQHRQIL
jgi:hypothetical protein